jgi:predicted ester cyclase
MLHRHAILQMLYTNTAGVRRKILHLPDTPVPAPGASCCHLETGDRPMSIEQIARDFFEACETGGGWVNCAPYCREDAGFACQSDALAETRTLADYAEWMKGLLGPIPDGRYELKAFAADVERGTVVAAAVFHGTQTGSGGPVEPTGKSVSSDYVYVISFEGDKISHMTKVWNDLHALRQLGWA